MTVEEYQKYLNEEELGYIKINKHPEDENIVILNYTEMVTFERRWNEQTMSSRGLILDLTDAKDNGIIYILARPFEKFFNLGENLDYEKDIDFNKIEAVMEKMDGSLGISYIINGELRFATRGSFTSEQAMKATQIWKEKYSSLKYFKMFGGDALTLLVEIIYPENRIVVDYSGREELVLLGATQKRHDYSYDAVYQLGDYLGLPVAPQYKYTLQEMIDMKKTISANEEGWIVRFANNKRLKIKGDDYLHVHRLLHGVSDKAKVRAWMTGEMEAYIMMLPEEFRPELEEFSDKLDVVKDALYTLFQTFYEMIEGATTDQKSFAVMTNQLVDKEFRSFLFDAKKRGSVSVELIREYIYKNYAEYLEVIRWNDQNS